MGGRGRTHFLHDFPSRQCNGRRRPLLRATSEAIVPALQLLVGARAEEARSATTWTRTTGASPTAGDILQFGTDLPPGFISRARESSGTASSSRAAVLHRPRGRRRIATMEPPLAASDMVPQRGRSTPQHPAAAASDPPRPLYELVQAVRRPMHGAMGQLEGAAERLGGAVERTPRKTRRGLLERTAAKRPRQFVGTELCLGRVEALVPRMVLGRSAPRRTSERTARSAAWTPGTPTWPPRYRRMLSAC